MEIQTSNENLIGKICHPKRIPDSLYKVIGPLEGHIYNSYGESIMTDTYILTNNFPKPHYIIIDSFVKNMLMPGQDHFLVYMITHSFYHGNIKVEQKYCTKSKIDLTNSYITSDKFLINQFNVDANKNFGYFDIISFKNENNY